MKRLHKWQYSLFLREIKEQKIMEGLYTGLLHSHSGLRWVVLVLMIVTGGKSLLGWLKNASYEPIDNKLSLFTLIATHTQILIGLVLYFLSPKVDFANMADSTTRYFTAEHGVLMLLVAAIITIGRSKSKKLEIGHKKHKTVALFYLISLAIVVLTVFVMMPA